MKVAIFVAALERYGEQEMPSVIEPDLMSKDCDKPCVTREGFVRSLTVCGLMDQSEVETFVEELPAADRPRDGKRLAQLLYRHKRLTKLQVQAVYQGKTRGLVVGLIVNGNASFPPSGSGENLLDLVCGQDPFGPVLPLIAAGICNPASGLRIHRAELTRQLLDQDGGLALLPAFFSERTAGRVTLSRAGDLPYNERMANRRSLHHPPRGPAHDRESTGACRQRR